MSERDPEVINSRLSRDFTWDGYRLRVEIYRLDDRPGWTIEVINEAGTSIVWDNQFATAGDAANAFRETLATEGLAAFLDDEANVIPFSSTRLH